MGLPEPLVCGVVIGFTPKYPIPSLSPSSDGNNQGASPTKTIKHQSYQIRLAAAISLRASRSSSRAQSSTNNAGKQEWIKPA